MTIIGPPNSLCISSTSSAAIHFHLPGVFLSNPLSGIVNGQLWTVPQELHCYLLMAVLMILGIATRPRIVLGLLIIGVVLETATLFRHTIPAGVALQSGASLVLCFLCGQVFYLWRDRIPVRPSLFDYPIILYIAVSFWFAHLAFILGVVSATYFVTYLGTVRLPRIPVLMSGDYWYGIYLYSFVLQQAIMHSRAGLSGLVDQFGDRLAAERRHCRPLLAFCRKTEPAPAQVASAQGRAVSPRARGTGHISGTVGENASSDEFAPSIGRGLTYARRPRRDGHSTGP